MRPTRSRGAVVVGAVVVGALAVGTGLAGCSAFQSCEEQDRRTRAGLEQAWPDEFGTGHRGSGSGACDDDPLYLSAGVGMTADEAGDVLTSHGWRREPPASADDADPEYPDSYVRKVGGHTYRFLVGDDGVELERA